MAGNGKIAISAVRGILQCGWAFPRRVSVVGFEDIAIGSSVTTALTTVALPLHPMGFAAGEMILRLLAGVEQLPENLVPPETHRPRVVCRVPNTGGEDACRSARRGGECRPLNRP